MAKSKTLRVAVAGPNWGENHLQGAAESEHGEPCALWGRSDKPEYRALADRVGVPFYTDYSLMLSESKPDVVTVATQEPGHAPFTMEALAAGCDVYCEKVISDSHDAAREMVRAAAAAKRELNIGYNYRYSVSCQWMRRQIEAGRIGEPLFGQLSAFTWCVHHMTDYVNSVLGTPTRVMARLELDPLADLPHKSIYEPGHLFETFAYAAYTRKVYTVEYESGALLQAGATDYADISEPAARLMIQGTAGRVELDDLTGKVTLWEAAREATVYTPSQILDPIGLRMNCVEAVKDFLRALAAGEGAPIPGQDGVNMILLEEAIMRASKSGGWEDVA
ncbi:MAG: hypothetical protein CMJ49_03695 [Planctomycetaceae bacterium]|nr:hypothetical protein [Planctomycetaceae bacterium]